MNKKSIQIKEIDGPQPHEISKPQWSKLKTTKIITDLADYYRIDYESSTRQIKTKFLWFPKTIDGKTKWLTKTTWEERLVEELSDELIANSSINPFVWIWKPVKWIEK